MKILLTFVFPLASSIFLTEICECIFLFSELFCKLCFKAPGLYCLSQCWDGVDFLHSSPYRPMFWICVQNSANMESVLTITGHCLRWVKAFPVFPSAPSARRLGEGKRLGWDSWPKGIHATEHHVTHKVGGDSKEVAWELAEICLAGREVVSDLVSLWIFFFMY